MANAMLKFKTELKQKHADFIDELVRTRSKYEKDLKKKFETESLKEAEAEMMTEQEDMMESDARKQAEADVGSYAVTVSDRAKLIRKLTTDYYMQMRKHIFGPRITERTRFAYYTKVLKKKLFVAEADLMARADRIYRKKAQILRPLFEVGKQDILSTEPSLFPAGWKKQIIEHLLE